MLGRCDGDARRAVERRRAKRDGLCTRSSADVALLLSVRRCRLTLSTELLNQNVFGITCPLLSSP